MKKICIKSMDVYHSFKRNETATMFFLKKTFSSFSCFQYFGDILVKL